ncbi:MAG UNVERIFIED_CONTAM: NUDIX domain-containing protein [Anaerolineae bacterium]
MVQADYGYLTPKIDTRAIVLNAHREVLMVRENFNGGRWSIPGGWADVTNSPSQNVEREVLEESGFVVRATRLLAVLDRRLHPYPPNVFSIYKLFFLCELLSDTPTLSPQGNLESSEWQFFAPADLPNEAEFSSGRIQRAQLLDLLARANDPTLPTLFD